MISTQIMTVSWIETGMRECLFLRLVLVSDRLSLIGWWWCFSSFLNRKHWSNSHVISNRHKARSEERWILTESGHYLMLTIAWHHQSWHMTVGLQDNIIQSHCLNMQLHNFSSLSSLTQWWNIWVNFIFRFLLKLIIRIGEFVYF